MIFPYLILLAAQAATPPPRPDPMTLGPTVGQRLPAFEVKDSKGATRTFESLVGPKGLVLVFFRSADWWPYCKVQLVELESQMGTFRDRGLAVAALSYDSADVLKDFAARRGITFPLLSDPDSRVIRAFGLLNEVDYPVLNFAHGVPFPGVFVTDASGVVKRKTFEKTYQERRTAASLLVAEGAASDGAITAVSNSQFTLKASLSNDEAAIGQRLTVMLDFEMGPRMHAYAPGVKGYRPLAFRLDPHPLVTAHEVVHPASKPYRFEPLNETVPVYDGVFRITQDLTVLAPPRPAPGEPAPTPITQIELTGTLDYQTCSDTICHAPGSAPLRFTVQLKPLDRERAPEALRRRP